MGRIFTLLYGIFVYAFFFITFLYLIGFVTGLVVPKTIDDGVIVPVWQAVMIDLALLSAFAVQHTIMARPAFKRWWTRIIPAAAERSTFVLIATAILALLAWQWRPIPSVVWEVETPRLREVIYAISLSGWALVLFSSFLIDHFDLFGLRQVMLHFRDRPYAHRAFVERSVYRFVRHPLMLGFLIAFWAAPTMTVGHLLFAGVTTVYILFGTTVEERDLVAHLGEDYLAYRRRTPMLIPFLKPRPRSVPARAAA